MTTRRIFITLLTIAVMAGCKSSERSAATSDNGPASPAPVLPYPEKPSPEAGLDREVTRSATVDVNVDSLIGTMTLNEKIGQLFTIPVYGSFRNDRNPQLLEWKRLIRKYHIGGLIFMSGDIYGQAVITNTLQESSEIPLWISQDMEYGAAMRVSGTTRITPAMGIAATGNPSNAFIAGQITAREAKALGVHQIYAPVLDVNNNPDNPVINVRSYSADPGIVSEFAQAFIDGVQSEGVMATGKHFPGHGDTDIDSHLDLPVIEHSYSRLDSVELRPFRSVINNGLSSIMSAHIAFPQISSNPDTPGTLDREILNGILADSLGFSGLIVTDGLEMSGISNRYSPGETVVMALQAGADVMLISPDAMTAIDEVEKAVNQGLLTEERIESSVRKILQLKAGRGLFTENKVDIESLGRLINTPVYQAEAARIARESITLVKNNGPIIPIRQQDYNRILFLAVADDESGSTGSQFASELRKYHNNVTYKVLDRRTSLEEKAGIFESAEASDLVIIGSFIYVRTHQPIQLTSGQIDFLNTLTGSGKPTLLIAFGNPYVLHDLPESDAQLLAWAGDQSQVRSTAPALFGASDITGRLPITIPDLHDIGAGLGMSQTALRLDIPESAGLRSDSLMVIDEIMQQAMNDSTFPGGVVAVARNGALVWNKGYGYHDYDRTERVTANTVYDLASVTKVMATTTAVMELADRGLVQIDDRVSEYIPEFNEGDKHRITIEHLLLHTSGLPAFRVYVDSLKTRSGIVRAVKNEPLVNPPGEMYVYSDLGFILLAEIVEIVSGTPLDQYVRNRFFLPMGMRTAHFNPARVGSWLLNQIPPTEIDTVYNRGIVRGGVHDERAWFMGGIAGHAGLFASALDVATWSQMLLNGGIYAGKRYLNRGTIQQFTTRRSPLNQRGYGFDRKSEGFSSAGSLTGSETFGHLGFTGTSVWIDPENRLSIILLTNRTWPSRDGGTGIRDVRPAIADAVMRSLID